MAKTSTKQLKSIQLKHLQQKSPKEKERQIQNRLRQS